MEFEELSLVEDSVQTDLATSPSGASGSSDNHTPSSQRRVNETEAETPDFSTVDLFSPAPTSGGNSSPSPSASSAVVRAPLATVSGTEVRQDPDGRGEYTVFNLCVRWSGGFHTLLKRWSECHRLHEALQKELGSLSASSTVAADGAISRGWPKGLELPRKTKRCSIDDERRIGRHSDVVIAVLLSWLTGCARVHRETRSPAPRVLPRCGRLGGGRRN